MRDADGIPYSDFWDGRGSARFDELTPLLRELVVLQHGEQPPGSLWTVDAGETRPA